MKMFFGSITFSLFLGLVAQANVLEKIEIKTPFVVPSCQVVGSDYAGVLKVSMDQFDFQETESQIILTASSSLHACVLTQDINQNRKLSWQQVNPYKGFEVQYYDAVSMTTKMRPVYIDPKKPNNRMELVALADVVSPGAKVTVGKMSESKGDSFAGTVVVNKSDVLTAKDIQDLEAGKTVQKFVELYHVSNFTTIFQGQEMQLGDEGRSAQNLIFIFKK